MTYTPERSKLRFLSLERAELFGKPHILAGYLRDNVDATWFDRDSVCPICRSRRVENAHHACHKGWARRFELVTPAGTFDLKSALFGLCGSGTTGCHDGFHGSARFAPSWMWYSDENAMLWWDGELLSMFEPHSPDLYEFGCWRIEDRKLSRMIEVTC